MIDKADFVIWMDSSVYWFESTPLEAIFTRAKERGLQLILDQSGSIAVRTGTEMFNFYGDDPCQYEPHGEMYGGYGIFHNEPFVVKAVLDPWVSCAFDQNCMCFNGSEMQKQLAGLVTSLLMSLVYQQKIARRKYQALIEKSEFLIWMDASIRWSKDAPLRDLFSRAAQQGLQLGLNPLGSSIAIRTSNLTFTFYGDQPCQYDPHGEVTGGFGVYHNEPFVRVAILEPWVTCAFDRGCMCVPRFAEMLNCRLAPPRPYGLCHRFDQSSLGIIVSKLFKERTTSLLQLPGHRAVKVARGKFVKWLGT
nr:hypothetical protein BaRGS_015283 [Batillaria attramentaria]